MHLPEFVGIAASPGATGPSVAELLRAPIIAGASVSAGVGTTSPGKRLSLRYTSADKVNTIAQSGAMSRDVEPRLTPEVLSHASVLLAVDLFFWDSTAPSPTSGLARLESLFRKTDELKIPVVLGDIPHLLPGWQSSRDALNRAIREKCKQSRGWRLLPLDELHRQIVANGFIEIKGRRYRLRDLVPDGLHLMEEASEYLADRMAQLLR